MPSQPLAPTFRENPGASASSRLGLNGLKVPAAISSARKARTSLRNCSHSGGRRIGSKRRAAVILFSQIKGQHPPRRDTNSLSHPTRVYPSWRSETVEVGYIRLRWERVGVRG